MVSVVLHQSNSQPWTWWLMVWGVHTSPLSRNPSPSHLPSCSLLSYIQQLLGGFDHPPGIQILLTHNKIQQASTPGSNRCQTWVSALPSLSSLSIGGHTGKEHMYEWSGHLPAATQWPWVLETSHEIWGPGVILRSHGAGQDEVPVAWVLAW